MGRARIAGRPGCARGVVEGTTHSHPHCIRLSSKNSGECAISPLLQLAPEDRRMLIGTSTIGGKRSAKERGEPDRILANGGRIGDDVLDASACGLLDEDRVHVAARKGATLCTETSRCQE